MDFDISYYGTIVTAEYRIPLIELCETFVENVSGQIFEASITLTAGMAGDITEPADQLICYTYGVRLGQFGFHEDSSYLEKQHAVFRLSDEVVGEGGEDSGLPTFGSCGENLTWVINDGVLTISGTGPMYDNLGVSAWMEYSDIKSVIIEEGVTTVGDCAFYNCSSINYVELPSTITSIGSHAFNGCKLLRNFDIPDSVSNIGNNAFDSCMNITKVVIPDGVESIRNETLYFCTSLKEVTIPLSVTYIGKDVFACCEKLKRVYFDGNETQWEDVIIDSGNEILRDVEIIYKWSEHSFDEKWTLDIAPTYESDGQSSRHCSHCDMIIDVIVIGKLVKSEDKFSDLEVKSWSKSGIDYVVSRGYMNGTGNGSTFEQNGTMTRAMIVSVLYRIANKPSHSGNNPFNDLQSDQTWYHDAVLWAYEFGIVSGTSKTTFGPTGAVTREQMATFLYRLAQFMNLDTKSLADLSKFPDEGNVGSWARDALAWANANGLVTGASIGGTVYLQPQGEATREQVATILARFCQTFGIN